MDSVFRSAREKLEKEHRESKENGKLILEREMKDKEAAEMQRRAVEASHRAKRLETIESLMNKVEPADPKSQAAHAVEASQITRRFEAIEVEDNLREKYYKKYYELIEDGDKIRETNMPPRIAQKRDYDVFESQVGDNAPGKCKKVYLKYESTRRDEEGKCKKIYMKYESRRGEETKKKTRDAGKKTESK